MHFSKNGLSMWIDASGHYYCDTTGVPCTLTPEGLIAEFKIPKAVIIGDTIFTVKGNDVTIVARPYRITRYPVINGKTTDSRFVDGQHVLVEMVGTGEYGFHVFADANIVVTGQDVNVYEVTYRGGDLNGTIAYVEAGRIL